MAYYYLHKNGDVIHKPDSVVDWCQGGAEQYFDSDFVVKWWKVEGPRDQVRFMKECKELAEKQGTGGKTSAALFKLAKWTADRSNFSMGRKGRFDYGRPRSE